MLRFSGGRANGRRRRQAAAETDLLRRALDLEGAPEGWRVVPDRLRVPMLSLLGAILERRVTVEALDPVGARALLEALTTAEAELLTERIGRGALHGRKAALAAFVGYRPALTLGRPRPMLYELAFVDPEDPEPPEVEVIAEDYGAEAALRIAIARLRPAAPVILPSIDRWVRDRTDAGAREALVAHFGGEVDLEGQLALWALDTLAARDGDVDWWRRARDEVTPWALGYDGGARDGGAADGGARDGGAA